MFKRGHLFEGIDLRGFGSEDFETLFSGKGDFSLSRIVSRNDLDEKVYEQVEEEWVVVLQGEGELEFVDEAERVILRAGDWILIPAGVKHKVLRTSREVACVWLALYAKV